MRLPPRDQLIMGLHTVSEVLAHCPEKLIKVFAVRPKGERGGGLVERCAAAQIPVEWVDPRFLDKITGSDSHQQIAAWIRGRSFFTPASFLERFDKERAFLFLLDEIFDPHNFGSILRTAECLGASGVIYSKNRGSDITPAVSKASSGASELVPLIRVSNLAQTLPLFQREGFEIVASLADPGASSLYTHRFAPRTIVILGSEGEGIQPLLRKRADRSVYIPMEGKLSSLNVATAAALFLSHYQSATEGRGE
jgi:23S rRNA (guanosine2251-2'-O)-methyltransferase